LWCGCGFPVGWGRTKANCAESREPLSNFISFLGSSPTQHSVSQHLRLVIMPAKFLPPQSSTTPATPLPYTASPWKLMWEDILLVLRSLWAVLNVILPLTPYNSGDLDELYPSPRNLANLAFQLVISLLQVIFLISIPVLIICMAPTLWTCIYIGGFILANRALCDLLVNRGSTVLVSRFPEHECPEHRGEHWVFINGVACG
jgi:hypothetical protein